MPQSQEDILAHLKQLVVPGCVPDPVTAGLIRAISFDAGKLSMVLEPLAAPPGADPAALRDRVRSHLAALPGIADVQIAISQGALPDPGTAKGPRTIDGVAHVVLVGSGKGGVGKSTVAANLALAMADLGLKVGLLDADIYGPSQPRMMGSDGRPVALGDRIIPIAAHGIKTMSIGYLMAQGKALVWRGPLLVDALVQMLHQVAWAPLDVLVVDLPPGTGDVQITLSQQTRVDGAVIVTTPQDMSLIDARRAIDMFDQTGTPIFGLIENMSTHICSNCGHEDAVFGTGGGSDEALRQDIPFLGRLPLTRIICDAAEQGTPLVRSHPASAESRRFHDIATLITACL